MSNGKWQLVPGRWACCYCIWCRRMEFQQDMSEEERSCREGANSSIKILCSCSLQATSFNMGELHTDRVDACLAVPCQLHFWQNDRGLLHPTAATRGWKRIQNSVI